MTVFGESHGEAVGVVLDGIAPGIDVDESYIKACLAKRAPSTTTDTARREKDEFKIVSGDNENDCHRLCKLFEKAQEHIFLFAFGKFVFAVLFQPARRFGGGQTVFCGLHFVKHLARVFLILFHKYSFWVFQFVYPYYIEFFCLLAIPRAF